MFVAVRVRVCKCRRIIYCGNNNYLDRYIESISNSYARVKRVERMKDAPRSLSQVYCTTKVHQLKVMNDGIY